MNKICVSGFWTKIKRSKKLKVRKQIKAAVCIPVTVCLSASRYESFTPQMRSKPQSTLNYFREGSKTLRAPALSPVSIQSAGWYTTAQVMFKFWREFWIWTNLHTHVFLVLLICSLSQWNNKKQSLGRYWTHKAVWTSQAFLFVVKTHHFTDSLNTMRQVWLTWPEIQMEMCYIGLILLYIEPWLMD